MIKIYYTTITGEDQPQDKINLSLGGYRSSTSFRNGDFGNLFDEITRYTMSKLDQEEYIGLIVKNDSLAVIEAINLWFDYPTNCYSKFLISAVDMSTDANGVKYMENISNINSKPVYSDFVEADGSAHKQDLGYLQPGDCFGLWVKRELLQQIIDSDNTNLVSEDPNNKDKVVQNTLSTSDSIKMYFSYNELGVDIAGYYVMNDRIRGATSPAVTFTVDIDGDPVDLTSCYILCEFKLGRTSTVALSLDTNGGITITDALNGVFRIDEIDVLDLDPNIYYYDIWITFPDNTVRHWIVGSMTVIEE